MIRRAAPLALVVLCLIASCTTTADPVTAVPTTTSSSLPTTTTSAPALTSTTTTTTIVASTTSTSQPEEPGGCRPNPFDGDVAAELAADYAGQLITAHVYDERTGCHYSLNPGNRQRTASVFKVMVMAGTLLEAQSEGRPVSEWEMSQLTPMITESADDPVRALWYHFGASPWFAEQKETFGLEETTVTADSGDAWGLTTTSARDQVDLLRQILLGEWGPLRAGYRQVALDLMTSVVEDQTWGVTAGVPTGWSVAQKNGFAGITINSVGWVDEPGPGDGYVVAILSQGWPDHPSGIAAVERVSELVAAAMTVE